jgi:D-ribose pyranase
VKKGGILHPELCHLIAAMGHRDQLVVADAGLPIPAGTTRIDLALRPGTVSFRETVDAILGELVVEECIIAEEMESRSPQILAELKRMLPAIPFQRVPHEQFKRMCAGARAVVRTGEFTPYANIILIAGVPF